MKEIFMLSLMGLLLLAANAWCDTLTLRDGIIRAAGHFVR
jgi:hypothetical protein